MWRRSRLPSDRPVRRVVVGWSHAAARGERFDQPDNERHWTSIAATPSAPIVEPVFFPLDEELELLPGELSATLAEGVARQGTKMPFEQAAAEVAFFWGVELDETTVRRYTQAAGAAYVAEQSAEVERLEREPPPAPDGPAVQYLSADGAMVPLLGGEWGARRRRMAAGPGGRAASGRGAHPGLSTRGRASHQGRPAEPRYRNTRVHCMAGPAGAYAQVCS